MALQKRIRGHAMSKSVNATSITLAEDVATWAVPDDIRVIGFLIQIGIDLCDEACVADGQAFAGGILSKVATYADPWTLGYLETRVATGTDTPTAPAGGQYYRSEVVMFPEGYGCDLDEGELMSITVRATNTITAANFIVGSCLCVVFYVER